MPHIPRLYLPGRVGPGPLALDAEQSRRLGAVMRLRPGDEFRVFPGDGHEYAAVVQDFARGTLLAEVRGLTRQGPPPSPAIHLWCGLIRANRFDWAIEKATEAGADFIRPLLSEYAARGEGASATKAARWARLAVEAAEQSGRLHVPVIEKPGSFVDLLRRPHGPLLLADGSGLPLAALAPLLPPSGTLTIAIGPEGGWSTGELDAARREGALLLSLGPNILRTETAAAVATALLRTA